MIKTLAREIVRENDAMPDPNRTVYYSEHYLTVVRYFSGPVLIGIETIQGSELRQLIPKWHLTKIKKEIPVMPADQFYIDRQGEPWMLDGKTGQRCFIARRLNPPRLIVHSESNARLFEPMRPMTPEEWIRGGAVKSR